MDIDAVIQELERLGFFRFTPAGELQSAKERVGGSLGTERSVVALCDAPYGYPTVIARERAKKVHQPEVDGRAPGRHAPGMSDARVTLSRDGHVAVLTLDRPERRNAMGEEMWLALEERIAELEVAMPRALVLTGAGDRAFCAGQDLGMDNPQVQELTAALQSKDTAAVERFLARERGVVDRLFALPVPIVAAVNGVAYGGGAELCTRCDLRVFDPAAVLCFSEVTLGLMPDWGGGVALPHLVGPGRAADLILTGRRVTAEEALSLGIANRVSAPGAALAEALELARSIARNGPRAVRSALEVLRRAPSMSIEDALALEMKKAIALIASGECVHGIAAFMNRQPPEFPDG